jgi:YD repeat-containing protein
MDQPALSPEVLPLPKGGGAARSIGDTFSPDLHTGTGSYRIPLWFPRGPGRFQPALALVYSSGAGLGMYGMGWQLPLMRIIRRTDDGVPRYDASDTLLLDGEEIVPVGGGVYRQLREQAFRRVERSGDGWIVREKDGRRAELGTTAAGRVEATDGGVTRTYAWLVERVVDPNGNEIRYAYTSDGAQRYLESISYGLYRVTFAYENRPDPFTLSRAGFELPVTKRGIRIDYRLVGAADPLFRRYTIAYDEAPFTRISLLSSVTLTGHRRRQAVPTSVAAPTLRFRYSTFQPGHRLRAFRPARNAPPPLLGLDDATVDLVDLEGMGRPGVAQLAETFQRYWPNRGDGRWAAPRSVRTLPAGATLDSPAVAFADMDGDFTADLLDLTRRPFSYYHNEPGVGLNGRARFRRSPSFAPEDPQVRLIDLDHDGVVDALRTSEHQLYAYYNRGADGWDPPVAIRRIHDPARFPDVFFSDPRVKLASMTGEGLADIVLVHGGRIDYWPNLGHGRFGARVTLGVSPPLGRRFDAQRLFLIDVDGDGRTDVVYVDLDRVHLWVNRGGRELVAAGVIRHTPRTTGDDVRPGDMLGRGTTGLVWSSPARSPRDRNYRFLDLTGPSRPYLMSSIDDGTGAVTDVEYEPSPAQEQRAREARTPWQTALPFPVQTITRIRRRDTVSGTRTEQTFHYRNGWADGRTREFRGFGRVETLDAGDAESPATRTVSYFLQGRPDESPALGAEARRTLAGRLARVEVFGPDGTAEATLPYRVEDNVYDVKTVATASDGREIRFPFLSSSTVRTSDDRRAPPLIDSTTLVYDDHGNVRERRERWESGGGTQELVTTIRCTADQRRWILDLAVEVVQRDGQGNLLGCTRMYYDGPDFDGLPLGQVTRGNLSRREEMVFTDAMVAGFGAPAPDLPALGYHRMSAPGGVTGWGSNTARERFDAQGNSIGRRDALGNTGRIQYELSGTYPIAVFDPLGRSHDVEYDRRAGDIALLKEPNGHRTRYRFDQLGRLEAMIKPGDSAARPTMEFEYLDAALPLGVVVKLRVDPGTASTQDEVEYVDGSGRTHQRRSAAEGGRVVVDGWRRDNRRGWEAEHTPPARGARVLTATASGTTPWVASWRR